MENNTYSGAVITESEAFRSVIRQDSVNLAEIMRDEGNLDLFDEYDDQNEAHEIRKISY